jgi:long-chain acyl-CoA synthetase
MSNGKNVAPQPIEQLLKTSNYIEQAVVIGDNRNFITALVVPNYATVEPWAKSNGISAQGPALAHEPKVLEFLEKHVQELCRELSQYEKVKKIALLEHELTPESGELTPTLKFKRRVILDKFKDVIEGLYSV